MPVLFSFSIQSGERTVQSNCEADGSHDLCDLLFRESDVLVLVQIFEFFFVVTQEGDESQRKRFSYPWGGMDAHDLIFVFVLSGDH